LERIAAVLARMSDAAPDFAVISIAGTNGKGSCAAMLEAILLAAGYRVGCYTSPHVLRYNERIHVNGEMVSDEILCEAFAVVDAARENTSITYFEFGTLAAIRIFQQAAVEVAILEVGLGGRLDAVNVLDADVALITAIDLDHQDWLGVDRESIGREKAGILRTGRPAVCIDPQPPQSVLQQAQQLQVPLALLGRDFSYQAHADHWTWQGPQGLRYQLPRPALTGAFQLANAAGVVMVLQHLATLNASLSVKPEAIAQGLQQVQLLGRFQQLPGVPRRILDVAHNPQSAHMLAQNLAAQDCAGRTRLVLAMLADKDISSVIRYLQPLVDDWYLAPLEVARGASLEKIRAAFAGVIPNGQAQGFASVEAAFAAAQQQATAEDRIVVAGSFYTVAAALAYTLAAAQGHTVAEALAQTL
jgi:dihydrofolate synthase/folylpolyglutamate synthase